MHFASYYRWLVAVRELGLPNQYNEPFLDIGTDAGEWPTLVDGPLCVGIDLNPAPVAHVAVVQGDAVTLPFPAEAFSDIWLFDVIEHVLDDRRVMSEALRVLRPGGCLWLSTTADKYWLLPGGDIQCRLERSWGHVRQGYSPDALQLLAGKGVTTEIIEWNEPLFRSLYVGFKVMQQLPGGAALLQRVIPLVYALDARWQRGRHGHLFMRIRKLACSGNTH